jgi:hypothetical protein
MVLGNLWPGHRVRCIEPACRDLPVRALLGRSTLGGQLSGKREEELLQFGLSQWLFPLRPFAGRAFAHAGGDDLESGAIERSRNRSQLSDDVLAVAPLLDHRDHAGKLALRAPQPVQYCGNAFFVTNHHGPFALCVEIQHSPGGIQANLLLVLGVGQCPLRGTKGLDQQLGTQCGRTEAADLRAESAVGPQPSAPLVWAAQAQGQYGAIIDR